MGARGPPTTPTPLRPLDRASRAPRTSPRRGWLGAQVRSRAPPPLLPGVGPGPEASELPHAGFEVGGVTHERGGRARRWRTGRRVRGTGSRARMDAEQRAGQEFNPSRRVPEGGQQLVEGRPDRPRGPLRAATPRVSSAPPAPAPAPRARQAAQGRRHGARPRRALARPHTPTRAATHARPRPRPRAFGGRVAGGERDARQGRGPRPRRGRARRERREQGGGRKS